MLKTTNIASKAHATRNTAMLARNNSQGDVLLDVRKARTLARLVFHG